MLFGRRTEEEEQRPQEDEIGALKKRVAQAGLPAEARTAALQELERLEKTDPSAPEYAVGRNYVDFVLALPWNESTKDNLDLQRAARILEARHFGLGRVKERVAEYLAVKTLRDRVSGSVLVVDDEPIARENVAFFLSRNGFSTDMAASGEEAVRLISQRDFDVVVTDVKMGPLDGMALLDGIRRERPDTQVVIVTGYATVDNAVDAMRRGADHYLSKPLNMEELLETVTQAVRRRGNLQTAAGPVLCFSGPPGTGKTSIGRAVAEALERKFIRFSLGGVRDEAEFRGHRRTYVGALPGRILKEMERAGVNNPVFMLDEIDKIGQGENFKGDAASVLLEVLDPEQNATFMDHYLDVPFDLSKVMFIATANLVDQLPRPLLDRLEIIDFPSYTEREKATIARRHLLPELLRENGLREDAAEFTDASLELVLREYTQEAGLRGLRRDLGGICRRLARRSLEDGGKQAPYEVGETLVREVLGPARFPREIARDQARVGVTMGLVWTEFGGEIIFVETVRMDGPGQLILTGSLGEVLRESARLALSYVRSRHQEFGIDEAAMAGDVHVHIPAGAVSKDGPSAGATIVLALISLFTGRAARQDVALSGELSLTGRLLPVAGVREKLVAAGRAGVRTVILPARNAGSLAEVDPEVREAVEVVLAEELPEIIDKVLE